MSDFWNLRCGKWYKCKKHTWYQNIEGADCWCQKFWQTENSVEENIHTKCLGPCWFIFGANFFYWIWDSFERKNMPKHFQLSQAVAFFQTIQLLRLSSLLKHDNLRSSRKEIVCINFQNESDHPVFSQYIFSLGSKIREKKSKIPGSVSL